MSFSVYTDARPEPPETDGRRRYAELLEEVGVADSLPYRAFCTTEQHGFNDGYLSAQLTAIAGLATTTKRIRFMTNAIVLPLHNWRNVVEQAIVADLLSGGRLELGMSAGGQAREFDLFGVDITKRAELMEKGVPFVRTGLTEGHLPDGPDGAPAPVLPRPAQARIPIYLGGLAAPVFDRAARLADGAVPVDFFQPETVFPDIWETKLGPALDRHGRTLDDFRFIIVVPLWASEDPERDWETFYKDAIAYHFGKYAEGHGDRGQPGVTHDSDTPWSREKMLVDTPENLAARLGALRERAPFHEVVFWYRIPKIGHERALEHMDFFAKRVMPLLEEQPATNEVEDT